MSKNKFILSGNHQLILLLFIAIGLNFNTIFNNYALDDEIVMTHNRYVLKGINGIPEILTNDLLSGFEKTDDRLSEGRYRPFALVIFAIEYELTGANPMVSHLINILLFSILIVLLYKLMHDYIFRERSGYLAFITCLLFAVHPVHTEVIANVKSRDELITFLFLIISLITVIRHVNKTSVNMLLTALLFFFLALLTRESAVTFIGVVPLILYFFLNKSLKQSVLYTLPLIIAFAAYMVLRISVIGFKSPVVTDVLNAPFLLANSSQAFATKIFILFKYIFILFFPHPLSWEYGYNQIPYIDFTSARFILSLLLLITLFSIAIYGFRKRSVYSFCILYFLVTISLAANFIVDIGTPFSERLLFQPSVAFCIAVAAAYIYLVNKSPIAINIVLLFILILFSVKTYSRNSEWKNNETILLAGANSTPYSIRVNMSVTKLFLEKANSGQSADEKKEYLKKAVFYAGRSLKIYPENPTSQADLATAYCGLFDYFETVDLWLKALDLNPSDPEVKKIMSLLSESYYKKGNGLSEQGKIDDAISCYRKSVQLDNTNIEAWYNLGGNYYIKQDTLLAIQAWDSVRKSDPEHPFDKEEFSNY